MKRCLILMLLLGLLLTACRKQTQPEQLPAAETAGSQTETESDVQTPEQTLTLGMIDFDTEKSVLRSMIQNYNFSSAPVRIEILNYADGAESRADAVTRMTTELLAGNVPDLLDCSDLSGAQYAGYAKNGILLPLDGMPEAELLSGILKPCYVDGTLYSVVGAFALDPLFGPAEKLGASLETSVEDVLCGAVPDVSFFWGGEDLLSVYCRHAAEQYLDYDTQTASFESEKFLNILTACTADAAKNGYHARGTGSNGRYTRGTGSGSGIHHHTGHGHTQCPGTIRKRNHCGRFVYDRSAGDRRA